MKKYLLLLPLILFTIFLSSCGSKAPTEKQLKEMVPIEVLQYEIDGELRTSIVDDFEITRQQTEEKSDIADCIVKLTDDYLNRTVNITINSAYWDKGGWMIDSYTVNGPEEYECVDGVIYNKDNFIVELISMGFNWTEEICDVEEQGYSSYTYPVSDDLENLSYSGSVQATATLRQSCTETTTVYYWEQSIDTSQIIYDWYIIGKWRAENIPRYQYSYTDISQRTWAEINIFDAQIKPMVLYKVNVDGCLDYRLDLEELQYELHWYDDEKFKTFMGKNIRQAIKSYGNVPSNMCLKIELGYENIYAISCIVEIYPDYAQISGGNSINNHGEFVILEKIS